MRRLFRRRYFILAMVTLFLTLFALSRNGGIPLLAAQDLAGDQDQTVIKRTI